MYRTIDQLNSLITALVSAKPSLCSSISLSNSFEGRPIYALRLRAGGGSNRRGVLIVGGMHARELMNPDAIIELAYDLAAAYSCQTGLDYGGASWSSLDIRVLMETLDIWMLPCGNPDGRNHVMKAGGDKLWRMNRRDNPGTTCDGVDVNRNCDFLWRVTGPTTTCDPCSPTQGYVGSLPFSESESQNIQLMCDAHRIDVFVDVHSFSQLVLYPWGHTPTQTTQPIPNFTSLHFGLCRPLEPPWHQEYMYPGDHLRYMTVGGKIADVIKSVRGSQYVLETIYDVYHGTTTGTFSDYVYSRHIVNPTVRKTYGFAFETGPDTGNTLKSFQPDDPEPVKLDTKAGLVSLLQQSVCAIEFIGESLLGITVQPIRDARDELLLPTENGRGWVKLVSNVQTEILGIVLSDRALTLQATKLFRRGQKLIAKRDRASVSTSDAEAGISFLIALQSREMSSEVREAISIVTRLLKKANGQTANTILKKLAKTSPPKRLTTS